MIGCSRYTFHIKRCPHVFTVCARAALGPVGQNWNGAETGMRSGHARALWASTPGMHSGHAHGAHTPGKKARLAPAARTPGKHSRDSGDETTCEHGFRRAFLHPALLIVDKLARATDAHVCMRAMQRCRMRTAAVNVPTPLHFPPSSRRIARCKPRYAAVVPAIHRVELDACALRRAIHCA